MPAPSSPLSRRELLRRAALAAAAAALPVPSTLPACAQPRDPDGERLTDWVAALRREGLDAATTPLGSRAIRVGELAAGTPYQAGTLDAYITPATALPDPEPLTLSLTRFDCVTLVESCLAVGRVAARAEPPTWEAFGREIERMRYRDGIRGGYTTRLHYFSEWMSDGARRNLLRDLGAELGGVADRRTLRFMTGHRSSYPALADPRVLRDITACERALDDRPRLVVPTARIPEIGDRIESGDILGFATSIPGLDVTHAALAFRDRAGVLRVLHAPLSGGVVELTGTTLVEYVRRIKGATGVVVGRGQP